LLAKQFGADVTLVNVVVDGVACDARVITSTPFTGIVQMAEEVGPDLLVIGPHRRQVPKDAFAGTTAERAIWSVSCPALMANAPPVANCRHVLQTTDMSDVSADAIRRFSSLGIGRPTHNSMLHVYDVPALNLVWFETPFNEAREYLPVLGTSEPMALSVCS